ncbi:MAG: reductive dehalogenase [Promethearchaeota archaeon]
MKAKIIEKPTYQIIGSLKRINQKQTVLSRTAWDPVLQELKHKYQQKRNERIQNAPEAFALRDASWYLADNLGNHAGFMHGNEGLYSWKSLETIEENLDARKTVQKTTISNPADMSKKIKNAGKFFGADLVGITRLNEFWVYSNSYNRLNGKNDPINISSEDFKFAIVMAIAMDYKKFTMSDIEVSAATGLGYSKMAFAASHLAQYIRNLGYRALPCGNDTAFSVPLAIDAGLGEQGKHGMLITPEFGPRVRLCKVITNLPLSPDKPIDFGVQEYCEVNCNKCVENCPAQAINGKKEVKNGVLKWVASGERCFSFWCEQGNDCSICIKVCPFNKKQ